MRISDWSSDVCSSDLGSHLAFFGLALRPRPLENLRSRGAGNGQHAVHIAENQVARLDHHAGEADREADFARAVLVGSAVGDAHAIHRKVAFQEGRPVAPPPVDSETGPNPPDTIPQQT